MIPSSERFRSTRTFHQHFADSVVSAGRGSTVGDAVERPQAIGVIASLVIGFSVLFMVVGVPKTWELFQANSDPMVGLFEEVVYGGFVLAILLLGCLGVATGIGLYLWWRWARVSILIFSALLPYVFIMMVIAFLSEPTFFGPGDQLPYIFGAATVLLVLGIWWLFYFNRTSVKRLFQARHKTPAT